MVQRLKTISDSIKTYSSTITAVFSALVVLYAAFKFVDQGNENTETNKKIREQMEIIQNKLQIPNARLDSIESVMRRVNYRTGRIDIKVDKLVNQFTQHLSKDKSVTKEELLQIMLDLSEKKN